MNEEEKKAIELLKDIRNNTWTTKYIMSSDSKNAETVLNLIEKLQKEKKELKEYYKEQNEVNAKFISVQKVKDKIEELDEELEIMKVDNMYARYKEYGGKTKWERLFATKYGMHDALQDLLI